MKKVHATKEKPLSQKIIYTLESYLKTQFVILIVVGVVTGILLTKLGVQFPFILAFATGALSIVPIFGITIAAILVSLVAIFDSIRFLPTMPAVIEGVAVIAIYGVLNMVMDYFVSPYLVGKSLGVHPVILLIAVVIGTVIFGIWGAILSVPILLVAKTIWLDYEAHKIHS